MPHPIRPADGDALEQAKAHFLHGLDCFEHGRHEEAEASFLASLVLMPGRVSTLVNLAATQLQLARPQDALATANQVLAIEADNTDAWFHRATALGRLQRFEEALQGFEKLLALDDTLAEPWLRHAQTLHALGRLTQAVPSYQRAVALQPAQPQAWGNLGGILRELNRHDEAAHAFKQALQHGGEDDFLRYSLASVMDNREPDVASGTPPMIPAVAPADYVKNLFDSYADDFDAHLLGVLRYRTPQVLVAPLQAMQQTSSGAPVEPARFESVLDLGCGTGLCGPLLKPQCDRLIGVDLSQGMLDKAALLGVYDNLAQGEIVEHLRHTAAQTPSCHDLVLAADVFVYIGDLAPVFEATWQVLTPGGLFCFSVELARSETLDFDLLPSLRFAHSERYVRQLAAEHGFELLHLARAPVREDQQRAIEGLLIHLRRPS